MRAFRLLVVLTLAFTFAGWRPAAAADVIQPGAYMETSEGSCTQNFIYDGTGGKKGKVYVGTAAHCVGKVGQDIIDWSGTTFGDVAVVGNEDDTETDWALIEVRQAYLSRVSAAVKGHPSYPKGFTTPTDTRVGDSIQLSGYGLGYHTTATTRERRTAVMNYDDARLYDVIGPIHWGDSGGPLVHIPTGKALGIVSRLCIGVCTEEGPTVQGILSQASAKGFSVRLRTV